MYAYTTWQPLNPGDTVYIVALSFKAEEAAYLKAQDILKDYGLNARWNANAWEKKDPLAPELSMERHTAFLDLINAFQDPNVNAIWEICGGRLSCEIWDFLDSHTITLPKKPLIGFSDTTSIHLWLNARGYATIHGPVLKYSAEANTKRNKLTSLKPVIELLKGNRPELTYTGFKPINSLAHCSHLTQAPLWGGNLSSLHYYAGAYGPPQVENMMMIETVDEPTRINSILYALRRSHFFDKTKAIIFGQLHEVSYDVPNFKETQMRCLDVVKRFALHINLPVFSTFYEDGRPSFQFGHGDYNYPIPLGTFAELKMAPDPTATTLRIAAS